MAKFKPLSRVLERVFKSNRSETEQEIRQTTSTKSRRWIGTVWRRKRSAASSSGLPRRSRPRHRLLPSFRCFKRRKNHPTRRSFKKRHGRGGRLLKLMSSFSKKKDEPTCRAQESLNNNHEASPHDSYILSMGGINILVEPYYHPTDQTAAGSASVSCQQTNHTAADCHSSVSTEPNTPATSQNVEEVISSVFSSVSCMSEELNVSADVTPQDWESSLESLAPSERHSYHEAATQESQPEIRQSCNKQNVKYEPIHRKEGDDETISRMEQSIAKIERISHQFCYPNQKRSSVCKEQDYKVTGHSYIMCAWQWITAISMVFILILLI